MIWVIVALTYLDYYKSVIFKRFGNWDLNLEQGNSLFTMYSKYIQWLVHMMSSTVVVM